MPSRDALSADAGAARRGDRAISATRCGSTRESAPTHYNLGFALSARGQRDEAMAAFEDALRLDPDYAEAHNNLGAMLQVSGRSDEAPSTTGARRRCVPTMSSRAPTSARCSSQRGRAAEAAAQFAAALALKADNVQALGGLAWIRATAADPSLRDAGEAVRLAEQADAIVHHQDVTVLDALAAAYATADRYEDAVRVARAGLDRAVSAGQTAVAEQFRLRVELYQKRQPLRMPEP